MNVLKQLSCNFLGVWGGQYFFVSNVEDVPPPHAKGLEPTDVHYRNVPPTYNFVEVGGPDCIGAKPEGGGECDNFCVGLLGVAQLN